MIDLTFFSLIVGALLTSVIGVGVWAQRYLWNRRLARVVVVLACLVVAGLVSESVRFVYGWSLDRALATAEVPR